MHIENTHYENCLFYLLLPAMPELQIVLVQQHWLNQLIPLVCNPVVMPLVKASTLCVTTNVTMNSKSMLLSSEYP